MKRRVWLASLVPLLHAGSLRAEPCAPVVVLAPDPAASSTAAQTVREALQRALTAQPHVENDADLTLTVQVSARTVGRMPAIHGEWCATVRAVAWDKSELALSPQYCATGPDSVTGTVLVNPTSAEIAKKIVEPLQASVAAFARARHTPHVAHLAEPAELQAESGAVRKLPAGEDLPLRCVSEKATLVSGHCKLAVPAGVEQLSAPAARTVYFALDGDSAREKVVTLPWDNRARFELRAASSGAQAFSLECGGEPRLSLDGKEVKASPVLPQADGVWVWEASKPGVANVGVSSSVPGDVTPSAFSVVVQLPWYRTWWAILGSAAGSLLALLKGVDWLLKWLKGLKRAPTSAESKPAAPEQDEPKPKAPAVADDADGSG